jgi:hypothetical protein
VQRLLLGQQVLGRGMGAVRRVLGQERDEGEVFRPAGWSPDPRNPGPSDPDLLVSEAADSWPGEDLDDPYGDEDAWWERA